jgi:hypothetical protein
MEFPTDGSHIMTKNDKISCPYTSSHHRNGNRIIVPKFTCFTISLAYHNPPLTHHDKTRNRPRSMIIILP